MPTEPHFVVKSEQDLLTATGLGQTTIFTGDASKIALARDAATHELEVRFIPGVRKLKAGWDTEEGILAALLATAPGRCYIREVPEDLLEMIHMLASVRPGEVN